MKTSTVINHKLHPGAKTRFIQRLELRCFECASVLPLVSVDDFLICQTCFTKHDLLLSRSALPSYIVNHVVNRPDGSRYSRKVYTGGQLELPF